MAIDDNTVYGLTGAQVKELPGKIEAVKGLPKELTADDYNWPTNNPTSVALWLLEPGVYRKGAGITTMASRTRATGGEGDTFIVSIGTGFASILQSRTSNTPVLYTTQISNGNEVSVYDLYTLVRNSLTSTSTTEALSANQGKVLNDKIGGDLANLTTTDKTSLINAINELAGQSGGGGVTELTSADYDYPDASPTRVALWRLPSGVYTAKDGVQTASSTTRAATYGGMFFVSQLGSTDGSNTLVLSNYGGTGGQDTKLEYDYTYNDGIAWAGQSGISFIDSREVVDNLTSTRTDYVLSANQGKVLKDLIDSIAIRGAGAPTTSTVGEVGQLYEDGTNGELYQLKSIDITVTPNTYNWEQVGGSSVNVVQATGTSTTDVMSQNAVTSMVYADPSTKRRVQIGNSATVGTTGVAPRVAIGTRAKATGDFALALGGGDNYDATASGVGAIAIGGYSATASGDGSIAIGGYNPVASGKGSIALGYTSSATVQGQMDIGSASTSYGYNNSNYRLLSGLYDPQDAHDAANKEYVDAANSYSTTEVNTGGTWVDGSTIYKKTINFGALPDSSSKTVAHGITNLSRVVKFDCVGYRSTDSDNFPIPIAFSGTDVIRPLVTPTNIDIVTTAGRSSINEVYVTLYYTKSS